MFTSSGHENHMYMYIHTHIIYTINNNYYTCINTVVSIICIYSYHGNYTSPWQQLVTMATTSMYSYGYHSNYVHMWLTE